MNTYQWFKEHTYPLDEAYDPADRVAAFAKSLEKDRFPLGIIYTNPNRAPFEESLPVYAKSREPLFRRVVREEEIAKLIESKI